MSKKVECCSDCKQAGQDKAAGLCPVCKEEGIGVSQVTVRCLVHDTHLPLVTSEEYKVCMSPACPIVYFSVEDGAVFTKDQVKVPIWFKESAHPRYACYCSKITEEQVLGAVAKNGLASLNEVIAMTGAMENPNCIENNPLGVCCHKIIEEMIAKGRRMRG